MKSRTFKDERRCVSPVTYIRNRAPVYFFVIEAKTFLMFNAWGNKSHNFQYAMNSYGKKATKGIQKDWEKPFR